MSGTLFTADLEDFNSVHFTVVLQNNVVEPHQVLWPSIAFLVSLDGAAHHAHVALDRLAQATQ